MTLAPGVRKLVLTAHLTVSLGWMGGVVAFLALVVAAMTREDAESLRAAWVAMAMTGWFAIVPLALASLLTGLVMSLGTKWGLFRHYWTLVSFLLTLLAVAVLLGNLQTVSAFARMAADPGGGDAGQLRRGLLGELLHAGGGLLLLVVIEVLNVSKPPGLTRYGHRRLRGEGRAAQL